MNNARFGNTQHSESEKPKLTLERMSSVVERVQLCRSEIYRRIVEGTFPVQIKIGKRSVAFDSREIDAWIVKCIAERNAKGVS